MNILFATDGSTSSRSAAEVLARFRFASTDNILILHAVPPLPMQRSSEEYFAILTQIRQDTAPKILGAAVESFKTAKAAISTAAPEGHPDTAIIDAVARFNADIIVMGARGLKATQSAFLGSVTRSVAITTVKPVLVVRAPTGQSSGSWKVLYATDGSEPAMGMASLLTALPFPVSTKLVILHIAPSTYLDIPDHLYREVNERIKGYVAGMKEAEYRRAEKIVESARTALGTAFDPIELLVREGDPAETILQTAKTERADIIAVGSSGMRGVKGMLGSVSRRILGHADCSVLIGKQ